MSGLSIEQVALAAAGLLVMGYVLLGLVWVFPKTRTTGAELLKVFTSATLIAAILIGAALAGTVGVVVLMVLVALRAGYEAGTVRLGAGMAAKGMAVLALGLCLAAMVEPWAAVAMAGLWPLLLLRLLMAQGADSAARRIVDLMVFPVLPMTLLAYGTVQPELRVTMFAAYAMVEIFDSFALLSGKLFGRRKAFPVLSPNKTVEGLIGGAVSLCLITALVAPMLSLPLSLSVGAAAMVAVLAIAGDLAASRLKRMAGVKDYPVVLRRQGGVLDSLDSWIAAGGGLVALHFVLTLL